MESPLVPGVRLAYASCQQILGDIDDARIYGGVHFRFDQEAGARLGRRVGAWLVRHRLLPAR